LQEQDQEIAASCKQIETLREELPYAKVR